jgi:hypothetical protein
MELAMAGSSNDNSASIFDEHETSQKFKNLSFSENDKLGGFSYVG